MAKDKKKKSSYNLDEFKNKFSSNHGKKNQSFKREKTPERNNQNDDRKFIYFKPADTTIETNKIDNFALKYHKFAGYDNKNKKFSFFKTDKGNIVYNNTRFSFDEGHLKNVREELFNSAKILFPDGNLLIKIEAEIEWRMVIGLGSESVYETSMTLHPIYGFPYIPGQAVKGMVRSWIIKEKFEGKEQEAYKDSEVFCRIFGCPKTYTYIQRDENCRPIKENGKEKKETVDSKLKKDYQGDVFFFDAVPLNTPNLEVDVMNPHYGPYYTKGKPPADYYNPEPIYFLTVAKGTKFQFLFGIKEKYNVSISNDKLGNGRLIEIVDTFFKEALKENGVGAKTSVGYGYFDDIK